MPPKTDTDRTIKHKLLRTLFKLDHTFCTQYHAIINFEENDRDYFNRHVFFSILADEITTRFLRIKSHLLELQLFLLRNKTHFVNYLQTEITILLNCTETYKFYQTKNILNKIIIEVLYRRKRLLV